MIDSYMINLPAYLIEDKEIRAAITEADKQGWPMADRVLLLPAAVGSIYGCEVVFSSDVNVPTLTGKLVETVSIQV